jgi:hypothetical protein
MKGCLFIGFIAITLLVVAEYFESTKDPYEEGMYLNYSIKCENGFVYKQIDRGTIQVLNSDGTPLKCGEKIY